MTYTPTPSVTEAIRKLQAAGRALALAAARKEREERRQARALERHKVVLARYDPSEKE